MLNFQQGENQLRPEIMDPAIHHSFEGGPYQASLRICLRKMSAQDRASKYCVFFW